MKEETKRNVEVAFVGEAKAYFRLRAFAQRADEEGYPQIARLFRAIAEAEAVHAQNHFLLLERVKSTEENLRYSFEREEFANGVAYPEFLKQAWQDNEKAAIWWFTAARNADERHGWLYKRALEGMIGDREIVYYVCRHCGWIEEGRAPDICPNCQKPKKYFKAVS